MSVDSRQAVTSSTIYSRYCRWVPSCKSENVHISYKILTVICSHVSDCIGLSLCLLTLTTLRNVM